MLIHDGCVENIDVPSNQREKVHSSPTRRDAADHGYEILYVHSCYIKLWKNDFFKYTKLNFIAQIITWLK